VVIAGLENNRLPNVQEIRRKSVIIQIIRPAEESDLWRKEEGFKRRRVVSHSDSHEGLLVTVILFQPPTRFPPSSDRLQQQLPTVEVFLEQQLPIVELSLEQQLTTVVISLEQQLPTLEVSLEQQLPTAEVFLEQQLTTVEVSFEQQLPTVEVSVEQQLTTLEVSL